MKKKYKISNSLLGYVVTLLAYVTCVCFHAMFPRYIILLFMYFDLYGFCTEYKTLLDKKCSKKYLFIIFGLHVPIFLFVCFVLYRVFTVIRPIAKTDSVFRVNDSIKFAMSAIIYFSIIIESMYKRRAQRKIWFIYKRIYGNAYHPIKRPLLKCLFYLAMNILSIKRTIDTFFGLTTIERFPFRVCYIITNVMCRTRIFYYVFYLELFFGELKSVNRIVQEIKVLNRSSESKESSKEYINRKICRKLKILRRNYSMFNSIIYNLNDLFGLSHFITIIFCFMTVLSEFNHIHWSLSNNVPLCWTSIIAKSFS